MMIKFTDEMIPRMGKANSLLRGTPYKPRFYVAEGKLRLFVERMGSGFANIDIPVEINYGNMLLMRGPRSCKRAHVPWGSTQDHMIASLATWVLEPGFKWREDYWPSMVKEHGHWLDAGVVAVFLGSTVSQEVSAA